MKKLLVFGLLLIALIGRGTKHLVTITSFQFTPNNFTVTVGDTVRWEWVDVGHTSTSTTIPAGAPTWDESRGVPAQFYEYRVTVQGTYSYKCTPHEFFGMVASFTANAGAPVTMVNFAVKTNGKGKAGLSWATLTEVNADYFSIQRSEDGAKFSEVGRVKAAGNSTQRLNYTFGDEKINPNSRYTYYRLQTVDLDGSKELSQIKLLKQDVALRKIIVKISPNPVTEGDHIQLWFNADDPGKLSAQLFDIQGRLVHQTQLAAFTGVNFGHLHIHDLPKGTYVLQLKIGEMKESVKVVVQE